MDESFRELERQYFTARNRAGLPPVVDVSRTGLERLHKMMLLVKCPNCGERSGARCLGRQNAYGDWMPRVEIHQERWEAIAPLLEKWLRGEFCCETFAERLAHAYHSPECENYEKPRKKKERPNKALLLQSIVRKVIKVKLPPETGERAAREMVEDAIRRGLVFRWKSFTPDEQRLLRREYEVDESFDD